MKDKKVFEHPLAKIINFHKDDVVLTSRECSPDAVCTFYEGCISDVPCTYHV